MTKDERKMLAEMARNAMVRLLEKDDVHSAAEALRIHDTLSRCAHGQFPRERKTRKKAAKP